MMTYKGNIFGKGPTAGRYTLSLRSLLLVVVLLAASLSANAQRDIFNWEVTGHAGLMNPGHSFEVPDDFTLFSTGIRLHRNMGRAWQAGINWSRVNMGKGYDNERTFTSFSLVYNWDNGTLFRQRSIVAPYHMIEGGFKARADYGDWTFEEVAGAVGFENGLRFRISDRLSAQLAYAVLWAIDERETIRTFDRPFASVWRVGVSYHFGAKQLQFRGPVFGAAERFEQTGATAQISPVLGLAGARRTPTPDTTTTTDTTAWVQAPTHQVFIDTIMRYIVDTVYAVSRDTIYLDSLGMRRFTSTIGPEEYQALQERLSYLEGYVQGRQSRDTLVVAYAPRTESVEVEKTHSVEVEEEEAKESTRRQSATQRDEPDTRRDGSDTRRDEVTTRVVEQRAPQRAAEPKAEKSTTTYTSDPALLEILKQQNAMIANQNALLRDVNTRSTTQVVQPNQRRMRTQIAPTVMVPLNDGGRSSDNERVAILEYRLQQMEERMRADSLRRITIASQQVAPTPAPAVVATPAPRVDGTTLSHDTLAARTEASDQRTEAIEQTAPVVVQAPVVAETPTPAPTPTPTPTPAATALRATYPAEFLFGLNKAEVESSYGNELDLIAADLKGNPGLVAMVTGYTDSSGNADYNRKLSRRRAEDVKRQLLERGVSAAQVRIHGDGQSDGAPKFSPGDRRVEVELLKVPK